MSHFTRLNQTLASIPSQPLSPIEHDWLDGATELAKTSEHAVHKIGCILLNRKKQLSTGINLRKTHPIQSKWNMYSPYLHAEMAAIIEASKAGGISGDKLTIVVSRYTRSKKPACSYPCRFCWPALLHAGVKNVICYDQHGTPTKLQCL